MSEVEAITFGCRLNLVESEAMKAAAIAAGEKDLVIVNTCAVTAESVRQSSQAIRRARRERPQAKIVVSGCAAMAYPERFKVMPEIDRIVDNRAKAQAGEWRNGKQPDASLTLSPPAATRTRAFVEVQNGCDHRCTFCIIPYGRGESRSRPISEVIENVGALAARGAKEVVLTGVDLTAWGADLPQRPKLGALVRAILRAAPALPRLRLSSIDSAEIDEELWDILGSEERFAPHLHLSLQSGSNLILKRMKRRHSREDAIRACRRAKSVRPEMAIGADLIVGFPTETETLFRETLALVTDCGLTFLHVFPFSARPGTPAARMPQSPSSEIKDRAARLRELGDRVLSAFLDAQKGRIRSVLVERGGRGRTPDFTTVQIAGPSIPGDIIEVVITDSTGRELVGHPLSSRTDADSQAYVRAPAR